MRRHGYFDEDGTYLVSYPRSGANWLRYCVEFTTKRGTWGVKPYKPLTPLDETVEQAARKLIHATLGVDLESPVCMWHSHRWEQDYPTTRIVLILRNFKECILRDFRGGATGQGNDEIVETYATRNSLDILCNKDGIDDYATLAEKFVHHDGPKHLVYYEDLKTDPASALAPLIDFLDIGSSPGALERFMKEYDKHNEVSVAIYNNGVAKSYTGGSNNLTFHSDRFLSSQNKRDWDDYVRTNHPDIVPIVERYFEND